MATEIEILKAPCGRGKTTWALKTITENPQERFVYVAPTKQLLDEFEARLFEMAGVENSLSRLCLYQQIDGDHKADAVTVRAALQDPSRTTARVIGICHESLPSLTCEVAAKRTVIIDEIPQFLNLERIDKVSWNILEQEGLISIKDDRVSVTVGGLSFLNDSNQFGDKIAHSKRQLLRFMKNGATKLKTGYAAVCLDPSILKSSGRIVILGANPDTAFLPEYLSLQGFTTTDLACDIDATPHKCINTEIFYITERTSNSPLPAISWLSQNNNLIATKIGRHVDNVRRNGCLQGVKADDIIWTANKDLASIIGKHLSKKGTEGNGFVPANARGFNEYSDRKVVVLLAATILSPPLVSSLQELHCIRDFKDLQRCMHLENLYQIVFRSALRVDEQAEVKIVCLTKYEAEWLAERLGAKAPKPTTPTFKKVDERKTKRKSPTKEQTP